MGRSGGAVGVVREAAAAEANTGVALRARGACHAFAGAAARVAPGVERTDRRARVIACDQGAVAAGPAFTVGAAAVRGARRAADSVVTDLAVRADRKSVV